MKTRLKILVFLLVLIFSTMTAMAQQAQRWLVLPFASTAKLRITEGYYYTKAEKDTHGTETHYATDIATDRREPVYAAADGEMLASYHLVYVTHNGKVVGFGLGKFVQIRHPNGFYTQYGHLDDFSELSKAAYVAPTEKTVNDRQTWDPEFLYQDWEKLKSQAKPVKRGDLIGYVGDSGLPAAGEIETLTRPAKSWDETHLHFEVFQRSPNASGAWVKVRDRERRPDPYGKYAVQDEAKTVYRVLDPGTLWELDATGKPRFAK